jgi:hypothetical protein
MLRSLRIVPLVVGLALLLTSCGEGEPEVIDVGARVTTATDALECADGAEVETRSETTTRRKGGPNALAAVEVWAKRMRKSADIPIDGYGVAVEEVGTVLFTHETNGIAEIAVIAERSEDRTGDLSWVVRSWARCRPGDALS